MIRAVSDSIEFIHKNPIKKLSNLKTREQKRPTCPIKEIYPIYISVEWWRWWKVTDRLGRVAIETRLNTKPGNIMKWDEAAARRRLARGAAGQRTHGPGNTSRGHVLPAAVENEYYVCPMCFQLMLRFLRWERKVRVNLTAEQHSRLRKMLFNTRLSGMIRQIHWADCMNVTVFKTSFVRKVTDGLD